jgi:hypothetical protein
VIGITLEQTQVNTMSFIPNLRSDLKRIRRMAHGQNAEKKGHAGKEYWKSRLHSHGETPGKVTKKMTHKKERRKNKSEVEEEKIRHI